MTIFPVAAWYENWDIKALARGATKSGKVTFFAFILQVIAMIIAAFASGGAALIAKIFLALLAAARLAQKIGNVAVLEEIEKNL